MAGRSPGARPAANGLFSLLDPDQFVLQGTKLHLWVRSRLWAQVLLAMLLGIATGFALSPALNLVTPATGQAIGAWLALPGKLFLGLIAIVLIPLVFCSIIGGLAAAPSGAAMRIIGLRLGAFILLTTSMAAAIGMALALIIQPGAGMEAVVSAPSAAPTTASGFDLARLPDLVAGVLPTNPAASVVRGARRGVVLLAMLTGIAATQVGRDKAAPLLTLLDAVLSISMTLVKWAMLLSPLAVFGLMAQLMIQLGVDTLLGMLRYVATVMLGLALLLGLYLAVLRLAGGTSVTRFAHAAGQTLLLAFSTSSSSAVMPASIQAAHALDVPDDVASLVIPVGATMNMAGTALYQSVAILFLAQIAGVTLGFAEMLLLIGTLVASSIGAPGTPGVSIAILASVATGFGIPAEGLVIILGIDRLLDMSRTVVNVTGDITVAVLLRRSLTRVQS